MLGQDQTPRTPPPKSSQWYLALPILTNMHNQFTPPPFRCHFVLQIDPFHLSVREDVPLTLQIDPPPPFVFSQAFA
jgi:hypothetical protein